MSVTLFTHPDMLSHRPGEGHPERPERLQAVLDALESANLSRDRRAATEADLADLERLHPADYVVRLISASPASNFNSSKPRASTIPNSNISAG